LDLIRVTGNSKKTQRLVDVEIVSAIKGSNQANPRSGGTTLVFGQTTTTNMPVKSTEDIGMMERSKKETLEQLTLIPYQNTTSSVRDFLAKASQSLGSEEDSRILEGHSSLRYAECYGLRDLAIYSLRMSKDCSRMAMVEPFKPFLNHWMNWGMTANGKCLTARTSESHKTGKGCSLSDILEENPDSKYFLSEKTINRVNRRIKSGWCSPNMLPAVSKKEWIEDWG